jgi:hypothetical protein
MAFAPPGTRSLHIHPLYLHPFAIGSSPIIGLPFFETHKQPTRPSPDRCYGIFITARASRAAYFSNASRPGLRVRPSMANINPTIRGCL